MSRNVQCSNTESNEDFTRELIREWRKRHYTHSSITSGNRNYFLYTNLQKQRHFHVHIYKHLVGEELMWKFHVTRAKYDRRSGKRKWVHFRSKKIPICNLKKFGVTAAVKLLEIQLAAGLRRSKQQTLKYGTWSEQKLPNLTFGNYSSPPRSPTAEERAKANANIQAQNAFNKSYTRLKQLKKSHQIRSRESKITENEFLKSNSKRLSDKKAIVNQYGLSNKLTLKNAISQMEQLGKQKGYIRIIANTKLSKNKKKNINVSKK